MKKSTLSILLVAIVVVCTSQKYKEAVTISSNILNKSTDGIGENSKLFVCLVHNEIIGNRNVKCPKCLLHLNGVAQESSQINKKSK